VGRERDDRVAVGRILGARARASTAEMLIAAAGALS
jgi:hypothetical protein